MRRDSAVRSAQGACVFGTVAVLVARAVGAQPVGREPSPPTESTLVREVENPISQLNAIPVEYQSDFGIGPQNVARDTFSLKPTFALAVTRSLSIVSRTNVSYVSQPVAQGTQRVSGLGDIVESLLLVPAPTAGVIWGIGPTVSLPTASATELGSGHLAVGPIAAVVTQPEPLMLGLLAAQTWSVAGTSDRGDIRPLALVVIGVYQLADAWYLRTSPVIVGDWHAGSVRDMWTVPVGGGAGKVLRIGDAPVDVFVSGYWNAIRPAGAAQPSGSAQVQVAVLLPR